MMRRLVSLAGIVCLAAAAALAAPGDGVDGTRWTMRGTDFPSWLFFWKHDHLLFREGKFVSTDFQRVGFGPAAYRAIHTADGGVTFTLMALGKDGGQVIWSGSRMNDTMRGQCTVKGEDGGSRTFNWRATQIMAGHPQHDLGPDPPGLIPAPAALPAPAPAPPPADPSKSP